MRTVLAFGTFDYVHAGHMHFLRKAKKLGDHLTVVVARDTNVKKVKRRGPSQTDRARLSVVRGLRMVDQAVLGHETDVYRVLKKVRPDVIALGYDQKAFTALLPQKLKSLGLKTKIVRIKAHVPDKLKSSKVKEKEHKSDAKVFLVPLAIIVRNGKVFIQQRNDPGTDNHKRWEFPGGSVEWGETPEEALIREVKEETGYSVTPVTLLPKIFTSYRKYKWGGVQIVLMPYICEWHKSSLRKDDKEVLSTAWVSFDQALTKKLLPNNEEMLHMARKLLNV